MRSKPKLFPTIFLQRPFLGVILGSFWGQFYQYIPEFPQCRSVIKNPQTVGITWFFRISWDEQILPVKVSSRLVRMRPPNSNPGSNSRKTPVRKPDPVGLCLFLYQYPVAVVDFMLDDLSCPSCEGFEAGLKFLVLILHLDRPVTLCLACTRQGETALLRLIRAPPPPHTGRSI